VGTIAARIARDYAIDAIADAVQKRMHARQ
jgi:hypothetical protein